MKLHYVSNKELLKSFIEYRKDRRAAKKAGLEAPQLPDFAGECFIKIAERLSRKPNFSAYTFREDMIADAVENCVQYADNFDPAKSKNPFSYFTQIIYFAFLRRIGREKKQLYVKYKAMEQHGMKIDHTFLDEDAGPPLKKADMYENISEFIRTFEVGRDEKKKMQASKKKTKKKLSRLLTLF